ncbi:MAG: hypothetical protein M9952_15700 [Microthrixaceae bacterium]|nr:hypothetical protein [Microthrixaceae bacterium]MCO5314366.1 hypothetical protein [Microthrixaceae bacterium]
MVNDFLAVGLRESAKRPRTLGATGLALTAALARAIGQLPMIHRDPFDRLLTLDART